MSLQHQDIGIRVSRGPWRPAIRPLADGEALAAIGDVHGHGDLLAAMHDALAETFRELAPARSHLVHLGDLIDRGRANLRAVDLARRGLDGVETLTLLGNHEDRFVTVLAEGDESGLAAWLDFGGGDVLAEIGVSPEPDWARRVARAFGGERLDFLSGLPTMHRIGDLVFVHAGIDPARALDEQDRDTLIWIRDPWLGSEGPYPDNVAVIHGHTPRGTVDLDHPHRINLDTGVYASGRLSALVIAGSRMRLVTAGRVSA